MENTIFKHYKSNTIALVFLALLFSNLYWWKSPVFGGVLLVLFLIILGMRIGRRTNSQDPALIQTIWGIWFLLSGIIIVGSGAYYIHTFSETVAHTLLLLSVPAVFLIARNAPAHILTNKLHDIWNEREHAIPKNVFITAIIVLITTGLIFAGLYSGATQEAVRSPWNVVEPSVFIAMFIAALGLVGLLYRGRERALSLPLTAGVLFSFLSAAFLVFPIGFGFDTFIHQATEAHIAQHGTITPKPLYYIGQYVLVLFSHMNFHLPVEQIDTLLVPLLTALLLPFAAFSAISHVTEKKQMSAAAVIGIFLFPLSSFIVTTPQGLANLWTVLLILASVPFVLKQNANMPWMLWVPALAALLIHPIAGIPAVIFAGLLTVQPERFTGTAKTISRLVYYGAICAGSIILPISFAVLTVVSDVSLTFDTSQLSIENLFGSLQIEQLFFASRFEPLLDAAYLFNLNTILIILVLAIAGMYMIKTRNKRVSFGIYGWMAAILFVNFLLLSTIVDFTFLIDYEKSNYADRLVPLATFFLAPLVLVGFAGLMQKLRKSPSLLRAGALVLMAGWITAAFYTTYPTDDSFVTHHGFNVSQSDINAVYMIDEQAADDAYVTLANQSVSAAAMRELGFDNYFGELFFYPIPTGGEMYALFLEMNENPSKTTARSAKQLVDQACSETDDCESVERVFYIVNDYWWQSQRLIEVGKQTSDDWFSLDQGAVHVFEYKF